MNAPPAPQVYLSTPTPDDAAHFLHAVARSRTLHQPWVSPPSNPREFQDYVARFTTDQHVAYFLRLSESDELIGVVNLSNIIRGAFCSGFLGYYAMSPFDGRGYMRDGLRLVLEDAFGRLDLHRVEANIQPENVPSVALVRACGFNREGYSPRYLKIAGRWRDHERWARLKDDPPQRDER